MPQPKFLPGRLVATPAALAEVERSGDDLLLFIRRHLAGDWGDLDARDKQVNEQALTDGSRLLSSYKLSNGRKVWVITEAADEDGVRYATTVLRPEDY